MVCRFLCFLFAAKLCHNGIRGRKLRRCLIFGVFVLSFILTFVFCFVSILCGVAELVDALDLKFS